MVEIGDSALGLALVVALLALAAGVYAGVARRPAWTEVAERGVWVHFGLVSLAMAGLFYAFATFDFQLEYVANHSARSGSQERVRLNSPDNGS